ncbi:MAG: TIM barrel protein [Planctomycetota bacterium]|nr:TIM barrel protein [Planctomycetota bacterium]MDA1251049.1 TIM barrel protein [Planctomycetota bacterium]
MAEAVTPVISRRTALGLIAGSAVVAAIPGEAAEETRRKTKLGLVLYCSRFRRDLLRKKDPTFDLYAPENFLNHCRDVGAGGMQCSLGVLSDEQAARLKDFASKHSLYIEAIVRPPQNKNDVARFDAELKTAAAVAAKAARTTIIPGRRYEQFQKLEDFKEAVANGQRMLELAAPVAERHRVPLAVENHKDQRDAERVALFEHISSEFIGACVDTGNSFALLEDPIETVKAFAPWAHSVHLKDQALQLYDEGFLLADIPLGRGGLDLKSMVTILKKAKPNIDFSLELITRDPLKVPCLTQEYWTTLSKVPARELARTLQYVRDHSSNNLQFISKMTDAEQVTREDLNVRQSLDYARDELALVQAD